MADLQVFEGTSLDGREVHVSDEEGARRGTAIATRVEPRQCALPTPTPIRDFDWIPHGEASQERRKSYPTCPSTMAFNRLRKRFPILKWARSRAQLELSSWANAGATRHHGRIVGRAGRANITARRNRN